MHAPSEFCIRWSEAWGCLKVSDREQSKSKCSVRMSNKRLEAHDTINRETQAQGHSPLNLQDDDDDDDSGRLITPLDP